MLLQILLGLLHHAALLDKQTLRRLMLILSLESDSRTVKCIILALD